jgi:hypothetical protein
MTPTQAGTGNFHIALQPRRRQLTLGAAKIIVSPDAEENLA